MSVEQIKNAAKARHANVVEELAQSRKTRLELNKRIKALATEEVESARILRAIEGRKKK